MVNAPECIKLRSTNLVIGNAETRAGMITLIRANSSEPWRIKDITANDQDSYDRDPVVGVGAAYVLPAPLDLHFHGAGGIIVPPSGDPKSIDNALKAQTTKHGTYLRHEILEAPTYEWLATLPVPGKKQNDPVAEVHASAQAISSAINTGCVGLRIEGLFLNPVRSGVWPPDAFVRPDAALLRELHSAARDGASSLKIVDLAPEMGSKKQVSSFIEEAQRLGVVISIAHTNATYEEAKYAFDAGARLATHLWNAMRPLTHRDPGVIAAALLDERVTCELICDGVHLHQATIELSQTLCGLGRWVAVSDASPFSGCEVGDYSWAGTTVHHDGIALRMPDGTLAGSASLLWQGLKNLMSTGVNQLEALLSISGSARKVLEPGRDLGIQVGDPVWVV